MKFRDIFRKDYKEWSEAGLKLGMSTVVQGFDYPAGKGRQSEKVDFVQQMRNWADEQALDIMGVMTLSHPNGVFTRQLLVWGLNARQPRCCEAVRQQEPGEAGVGALGRWQSGPGRTGGVEEMLDEQPGMQQETDCPLAQGSDEGVFKTLNLMSFLFVLSHRFGLPAGN